MSTVNQIIKNRHTTRLMTEQVSEGDLQTILDSARRAPSKNRIYGYKILSLTDSARSIELKQELCDKITLYKDDNETVYLKQTLAPLVLVYMATPAPEHQMVGLKNGEDLEVYNKDYNEVNNQIDLRVMAKNSIRDAMISATYAQLTAEDLGYGTAYVACGAEDLMSNKKFIELFKERLPEYDINTIEPVVILCIGKKHQTVIDLYSDKNVPAEEQYLDGVTHYKRSGREASFVVNNKQRSMIVNL